MADASGSFREHSIAEFFKKNRQMLGFSGKVRSLTTLVHEFVTNSLDACEEAGILPDILVQIEQHPDGHVVLTIEDNGPGLPKKLVAKALGQMLAGTKFHRFMQQRGQQGIGASGAVMYSQITTGKPVYFKTGLGDGKAYEGELSIDFKANKPIVANDRDVEENYRGLKVVAIFGDVKYDRSEYSPFEYVKRTALANPHAQIRFIEPTGERVLFPRASELVPGRPAEIQPHPLGITVHDLLEYAGATQEKKLSVFLVNAFSRFSQGKAAEVKSEYAKIVKERDSEALETDAEDAAERVMGLAPRALKWEEAERLVESFKRLKWVAPETDALRPIGPEQVEKALKNIFNPEFTSVTERRPKVFRGGIPFMVEAAIAYGGNSGCRKADGGTSGVIMRFANRVPLLFDAGGCAITSAVKGMDWKRYDIRDFDNEPVSVFVNLVSVHVPYTGAGKQAISDEEEVVEEVRLAVMDAARRMQLFLHGRLRERNREVKKKAILRYIPQFAQDLVSLSGKGNAKKLQERLTSIVESKYSQLTLGEAEEEADASANCAPEKPGGKAGKAENGNGEDEEE
ncbi:MAG: DNA topoisomerase VI subunit B [Candidatus ainarchaeum sp.]|nr:DNA topoisomerase VI subunit B [Candidatus ainarchaeum sp.]